MSRAATPALTALLNAAGGFNPLIQCDIYYFTLANGLGTLLYTEGDFPVTAADATIWGPPALDGSGTLWQAGLVWAPGLVTLPENGAQGHWQVGLGPDTWEFDIVPRAVDLITGATFPDTVAGQPWIKAAASGALDGADLIVSTAYFAAMPKYPSIPLTGVSPVGTLLQFRGRVGPVSTKSMGVHIVATDYRAKLNQMMPRNVYQSGCRLRLYDTRCGVDPAGYTQVGVAAAGSTRQVVQATANIAQPGGSNTFELGVLTMTSGANNGISRLVAEWDGAKKFTLLAPFPFAVGNGDTFSVAAGCNKSMSDCTAFANLVNFNAEPYVVVPEVQTG